MSISSVLGDSRARVRLGSKTQHSLPYQNRERQRPAKESSSVKIFDARSLPLAVLTRVAYSVGGGVATGFAIRFFGLGLTAICTLRFQKVGSTAAISFAT